MNISEFLIVICLLIGIIFPLYTLWDRVWGCGGRDYNLFGGILLTIMAISLITSYIVEPIETKQVEPIKPIQVEIVEVAKEEKLELTDAEFGKLMREYLDSKED